MTTTAELHTGTIHDTFEEFERAAAIRGHQASEPTLEAYAKLMRYAASTEHLSTQWDNPARDRAERRMDKLRAEWNLCQLMDAGVVRRIERGNGRTLICARGWIGERAYRTTRELEAFVHGAMAALDI